MSKLANKDVYILRIGLLVIVAIIYVMIPGVQEFIHTGFSYVKHRDFEKLRQFILSYGIWAPLTSIALMALQSLVPLVPGLVVTVTNAWIFGWGYGALYSWIGALLGAVLDFGIARWYGRPLVEKIINSRYINWTDTFFKRHGVLAVFITRITPIIPFKVISYSAGLTSINLYEYTIATGIGQTPAIVLYSILGQHLTRNIRATIIVTTILIIIGILLVIYRDSIERFIFKKS